MLLVVRLTALCFSQRLSLSQRKLISGRAEVGVIGSQSAVSGGRVGPGQTISMSKAMAAWTVASPLDAALHWRGAMAHTAPAAAPCGCAGLLCAPLAKLDAWARTFYDPILIKDDLAALTVPVPAHTEATVDVDLALTPLAQFDQGGVFVWVADGCFVKAGLEFADGTPRLSVVVTNNGWSDWSTQDWPRWAGGVATVRVRLHKLHTPQGACILVEADIAPDSAPPCASAEAAAARPARWSFVRIAPIHVPAASRDAPWQVGAFAASPVAAGGSAVLRHLRVGPRDGSLVHSSDWHE